jgi:hypothetical protein
MRDPVAVSSAPVPVIGDVFTLEGVIRTFVGEEGVVVMSFWQTTTS